MPLIKAGGRPAAALVRDSDWELVVKAIHSLPHRLQHDGPTSAWVYADTQLRSLIDSLALARLNSRARVQAVSQIHAMLDEGSFRVLAEDTMAGLRCRGAYLRAIERKLMAPTMRAAFERSFSEDESYKPDTDSAGDR